MGEPAALRLLADRVGHLLLEVRVGVNDVPAFGHGGSQGIGSDAEDERHGVADHLIRHEEEDGGEGRHDEHHQGGDHGLAPGRPRDLLGLGADLLEKLERTDLRHLDFSLCLVLGHVLDGPPATSGRPALSPLYISVSSGKAPRRA